VCKIKSSKGTEQRRGLGLRGVGLEFKTWSLVVGHRLSTPDRAPSNQKVRSDSSGERRKTKAPANRIPIENQR